MGLNIIESETEAANLALALIADTEIGNIDANEPLAKYCRRWLDHCRDLALRSHRWWWAGNRAELVRDSVDPIFDWSAQFIMPDDFLRLREYRNLPLQQASSMYRLERAPGGGSPRLLTNDTTEIRILYTARVKTVSEWSPDFTDALAYLLASKIARHVTQSTKTEREMFQMWKMALGAATLSDARENKHPHRGPTGAVSDSRLVRARRGSGSDRVQVTETGGFGILPE